MSFAEKAMPGGIDEAIKHEPIRFLPELSAAVTLADGTIEALPSGITSATELRELTHEARFFIERGASILARVKAIVEDRTTNLSDSEREDLRHETILASVTFNTISRRAYDR